MSHAVRDWVWTAAAVFALLLIAGLLPRVPGFYDLLPFANPSGFVQSALISSAVLLILFKIFPNLARPETLSVAGLASFFAFAGWRETLLLVGCVALWSFLCLRIKSRLLPVAFFLAIAAIAYRFRIANYYGIFFWWCYVHFTKFAVQALPNESGKSSMASRLAFFFSPPLLFGPLVSEWICVDTFESTLKFRQSGELMRSGLRYVAGGAVCVGLATLLLRLQREPIVHLLNPSSWNKIEGDGITHVVAGFSIFFSIYWKRAGLTAVAAGIFRFLGCDLPYDYHYPLISKSHLEFCQRYHMNVKNFLSRYVFLPTTLQLARRLPWNLASAAGIGFSLICIGVAQFFSFVPLAGTPFAFHYSFQSAMFHRSWEAAFILFTFALSACAGRLLALGNDNQHLRALLLGLRWLVAIVLVSFFFFNTYAICWMHWSNPQFLKAMLF